MTEQEYRSHPALSRSTLWKLHALGTPEKFRWWLDHPAPGSPALVFGQMVHKLLLQPDTFDKDFVIAPVADRRTKEGKAAWSEFIEKKGERTEVSREDYCTAAAMVKKLRETPFVMRLLEGVREGPIFWTDEGTGLALKARLDVLTEIGGEPVIVDYKSAADASDTKFARDVVNYGYDFQVAYYTEAVKALLGKTPRFIFIVQEKEDPFAVNIFEAEPLMLQRGYDLFRELLGLYKECSDTGNWYGYLGADAQINTLMLPAWAYK